MNYICYKNGEICPLRKKVKDTTDVKFYLIDISTNKKGPVYTIVKDINYDFDNEPILVSIDCSYSDSDVPFTRSNIFQSRYEIDTINKYYSIYPLVKQMCAFNTFMELYDGFVQYQLSIDELTIKYGKNLIQIMDTAFDKLIRKSFKKMKMATSVSSISEQEFFIVIKNHKYKIVTDLDCIKNETFDSIFISIPYTETGYLLTYTEYLFLDAMTMMEVSIINKDEYFEYETRVLEFFAFEEYLSALLFIPQLMMIEKEIFYRDQELNYSISFYFNQRKCSIEITEEDLKIAENQSILNIIRLLMDELGVSE